MFCFPCSYVAGVGEPVSLFFEDLMEVFPEAKVLLNVRPAEDWYTSMYKVKNTSSE